MIENCNNCNILSNLDNNECEFCNIITFYYYLIIKTLTILIFMFIIFNTIN